MSGRRLGSSVDANAVRLDREPTDVEELDRRGAPRRVRPTARTAVGDRSAGPQSAASRASRRPCGARRRRRRRRASARSGRRRSAMGRIVRRDRALDDDDGCRGRPLRRVVLRRPRVARAAPSTPRRAAGPTRGRRCEGARRRIADRSHSVVGAPGAGQPFRSVRLSGEGCSSASARQCDGLPLRTGLSPRARPCDLLVVAAFAPELAALQALLGRPCGEVGGLVVAARAVGIGLVAAARRRRPSARGGSRARSSWSGRAGPTRTRARRSATSSSRGRSCSSSRPSSTGRLRSRSRCRRASNAHAAMTRRHRASGGRSRTSATTLAVTTADALAARLGRELGAAVEHLEAFARRDGVRGRERPVRGRARRGQRRSGRAGASSGGRTITPAGERGGERSSRAGSQAGAAGVPHADGAQRQKVNQSAAAGASEKPGTTRSHVGSRCRTSNEPLTVW